MKQTEPVKCHTVEQMGKAIRKGVPFLYEGKNVLRAQSCMRCFGKELVLPDGIVDVNAEAGAKTANIGKMWREFPHDWFLVPAAAPAKTISEGPTEIYCQLPGNLPDGATLDSMLTPEQFAVWQQVPVATLRKKLGAMPGVIRESRKRIVIHPRTYLESRLKKGSR